MTFSDFGFDQSILEGISSMGYTTPTPIQEQGIPVILQNQDLIGCAQTGTGKTAAYLLPVMQHILHTPGREKGTSTLILVPTRELALQIDQQMQGMAYFTGVSSIPVYGGGDGSSWDQQKNAFSQGADTIIATPGRLIAHIQLGYVNLTNLKHLILDEADRMLDMGFHADIIHIVEQLNPNRQTLLFSATMPPGIRKLASELLKDPVQIDLAVSKPAEGVLQAVYHVEDPLKLPLLKSLLREKNLDRILIFASTKSQVKQLHKSLYHLVYKVEAIHSDLQQKEREQVLLNFKNAKTNILVATDIVSRGIDIENIDLVINYHVPQDAEDYVHRVGRTARAKASGVALTFVNHLEKGKLRRIEQLIESKIFVLPVPDILKA